MRAQGFAQTNFTRAFGDGNQHNIHNANAANQQTDAADGAQKQTQRCRDRVGGFQQAGLIRDRKVIRILLTQAMPQTQGLFDTRLGQIHLVFICPLDTHARNGIGAAVARGIKKPALGNTDRRKGTIVVAAKTSATAGF